MFKTGDIIDGRYEIKEQIGAGGGGTVYKAYDKSMRMDVAIKLVKDLLLTSSELEVRTEVDLIKRLKHKYLPTVYNFVESDNAVYMVMEYIDGHDIKALSDMGRTFNEDTIIRCGIQICEALDELHSQKPPIIHGDIKPSNIMLTPADNICLIDFNISSVMKGNKAILHGYSKGYAAPEQTYTRNGYKQLVEKPVVDEYHEETRYLFDETAMGKTTMLDPAVISDGNAQGPAYIDVRTDIYGVGAVLYFMLTGCAPVGGNVDFTGINASSKLKVIISKAMAREPDKRYKNAEEMREALCSEEKAATTPTVIHKPNRNKIIAAVACAIIAVVAVTSIFIFRENNSDNIAQESTDENTSMSVEETVTETVDNGFDSSLWGKSSKEIKDMVPQECDEASSGDNELCYNYVALSDISEFDASYFLNAGSICKYYYFDYSDFEYDNPVSEVLADGLYRVVYYIRYSDQEKWERDVGRATKYFISNYGELEKIDSNSLPFLSEDGKIGYKHWIDDKTLICLDTWTNQSVAVEFVSSKVIEAASDAVQWGVSEDVFLELYNNLYQNEVKAIIYGAKTCLERRIDVTEINMPIANIKLTPYECYYEYFFDMYNVNASDNTITKGFEMSKVKMYYKDENAMRKDLENINDGLMDSEYEFNLVDPVSEYDYLLPFNTDIIYKINNKTYFCVDSGYRYRNGEAWYIEAYWLSEDYYTDIINGKYTSYVY